MFTIHPNGVGILMKGSVWDITTAFVTGLLGILALAGGVDSWFFKKTTLLEWTLLIIAGLSLMYPAGNLKEKSPLCQIEKKSYP